MPDAADSSTDPSAPPPIVGVGGATAALDALLQVVSAWSAPDDVAIVVVAHRTADDDPDLIARLRAHTSQPVRPVTDETVPEAGTVYVLPPGMEIRMQEGQLRCRPATTDAAPPSIVDTFFRSLADAYGERAIGVLTLGNGSDGARGLRALDDAGAVILVQPPVEAALSAGDRIDAYVDLLLDIIGAVVIVTDPAGRIERLNEAATALTGIAEADAVGASLFETFVAPDDVDDVRALYARLRDDAGPVQHDHHWRTNDGAPRLLRWAFLARPDATGAPTHVVGLGIDITRRQRLEREVIAISEKERQRIAQDLHDLLASQLSGTAMMIEGTIQRFDDAGHVERDRLEEIAEFVKDARDQTRDLSHSLLSLKVHGGDLVDVLHRLVEKSERMSDVSCTLDVPTPVPEVDADVGGHLYRIAAEAVQNALKHAEADRVDVCLVLTDDRLTLRVEDDGVGLPDAHPSSDRLGLNIMAYRADLINGTLDLTALPDGGTCVRCTLPRDRALT